MDDVAAVLDYVCEYADKLRADTGRLAFLMNQFWPMNFNISASISFDSYIRRIMDG